MMQTSEQTNEISAALAKAQAELENVEKGGNNPHFKAKYATLPGVLAEVRPKLSKHGIYIGQFPVNGEGSTVGVITRFSHSSGQWIESAFYVAPTKFDAQGAGSVVTYLRRYALMAMAGVSGDDDDGNAAVRAPTASDGNGYDPAVSTEQRKELIRLVDEGGGDTAKAQAAFLKWAQVDSFANIPASLYEDAKAAIARKNAKNAAPKAAA